MSASRKVKYFLLNNILSSVVFFLLYLYTATLRVKFEGNEKVQKHLEAGGKVIISSWHQRFFGGFFLPQIFEWSPCIIISQSRDGDFISRVVSRIGWTPVRGSSKRGGKQALQVMTKGVNECHIGGHIVDGPTGPPHIIKPGLISLAKKTGAVICPGVVSYEKAWMAKSWDRFMIPKPFSRVLFRFGSIFPMPEITSDEQFESFRRELEVDLISEYEEADNYWKK
jgi:lysophospholipid acyltransferase (LPLAT)-like uncharacterized protein